MRFTGQRKARSWRPGLGCFGYSRQNPVESLISDYKDNNIF